LRSWFDSQLVSDYNWNGQGRLPNDVQREWQMINLVCAAGEDFDRNLHLPNIDFVTYVSRRAGVSRLASADGCIAAHVSSNMVCLPYGPVY
jgi:hypothetical protein